MARVQRHARRGVFIDAGPAYFKQNPIIDGCFPERALFPLIPQNGIELEPTVLPGDLVQEGGLLGRGPRGTTRVHSSIPGRVSAIKTIKLASGERCKAVEVELGGSFPFQGSLVPDQSWKTSTPEDILALLERAGIGSENPQGPCLADELQQHIDVHTKECILNILETEPHHRSNSAIALAKPKEVAMGLSMVLRILGLGSATIVCPPWLNQLLKPLFDALEAGGVLYTLAIMEPKFPAHRPEVLLPSLHRVDPATCVDPLKSGAFLIGPQTLFHVYEAVVFKKPQIERVISISGTAFHSHTLVRSRIGTPLWQLMEDAGGLAKIPEHLVINEVMTGFATKNIDLPVDRTLHSLIGLHGQEINESPESDCINCGECVRHCPMGLEPERLIKLLRSDRRGEAVNNGLELCTGCGLCSHICPSRIPLTQAFRIEIVAHRQGRASHEIN